MKQDEGEKITSTAAEVVAQKGEEETVEEEAKEASEMVKPPMKVPTLYVRNLNDKLKIEGK